VYTSPSHAGWANRPTAFPRHAGGGKIDTLEFVVRRHTPSAAPDHRDGSPSPRSFYSARRGHWSVLLRPSQRTPAQSRGPRSRQQLTILRKINKIYNIKNLRYCSIFHRTVGCSKGPRCPTNEGAQDAHRALGATLVYRARILLAWPPEPAEVQRPPGVERLAPRLLALAAHRSNGTIYDFAVD